MMRWVSRSTRSRRSGWASARSRQWAAKLDVTSIPLSTPKLTRATLPETTPAATEMTASTRL
jgi:hypothetical protein